MGRNGTDCRKYFKADSACELGEECSFRHEPAALNTSEHCRDWLRSNKCDREHCVFRHPAGGEQRKIIRDSDDVCYSWLRNECHREKCRFAHPLLSSRNETNMKQKLTHLKGQRRYDPLRNAYAQIVAKGINPDSIFDVSKEPIKVNLELHETSPDRRNIQQAAIPQELLSRKILIPKHPSEYAYSYGSEDVHVKTFDEICRERELQLKLHLAKMKYAKRLQQGEMEMDGEYSNGRSVTVVNNPVYEIDNTSQFIELRYTRSAVISPVRPPQPQQNLTRPTQPANAYQPDTQSDNSTHHSNTYTNGFSGVQVKSECTSFRRSIKSRLGGNPQTTPPRLVSAVSSNTSDDSDLNMSVTSVKSEPEFLTPPPLTHANYDENMPVLEIYPDPDSDQQLINELNAFIQ